MKPYIPILAVLCLSVPAFAQNPPPPEPPVPIVQGAPQPQPPPAVNDQRLYGPSTSTLISPEQAQAIVGHFKDAYAKLGSPRILFYVNRELVDSNFGLSLSGRKQRTTSSQTNVRSDMASTTTTNPSQTQVNVNIGGNAANDSMGKGTSDKNSTTVVTEDTYKTKSGAAPTIADRQTVRDIERLFGRPFRMAGAKLADQKVAAATLDEKSLDHFSAVSSADQASRDRTALAKVADVAIEILVSSRNIVVPEVSGDHSYSVPDIQATAIRLNDAQILGQATAADVLGRDRQAGRIARNFGTSDIAEATALALMEDISGTAK